MVFGRKFCEKAKFGYLNPILGKLGVTHDLRWWLAGTPIVNFLFASIELSSLSVTVPELWGETYTARCFHRGSTSLHSNFTWTVSSHINHSWHQWTRETRLPDGENHIPLFSLVLTQYQSVSDRRTDRQTDGRIYTYTGLAKLALRHAVKHVKTRFLRKIKTLKSGINK